jgi:hypothetical protein
MNKQTNPHLIQRRNQKDDGMGYSARLLQTIKIQHTNDEQANKFRPMQPPPPPPTRFREGIRMMMGWGIHLDYFRAPKSSTWMMNRQTNSDLRTPSIQRRKSKDGGTRGAKSSWLTFPLPGRPRRIWAEGEWEKIAEKQKRKRKWQLRQRPLWPRDGQEGEQITK